MDFIDTFYGRSNTVKTYESLFRHHIKHIDTSTIDEYQFQKWVDCWMKCKLAPNTIKILIRLLRKYIIFNGGPDIDTTRFVRYAMKFKQKQPVKALTKEEALSLIDISRDTELEVPIALGLYTGMRRGEVWGLQDSDIDFIDKTITVNRSYNGPTKSGLSRIIPMSNSLYNILYEQGITLNKFDPNPLLKSLCKKAKVPVISFHGLRHTFATTALNAGRSPREVASILGHASVSTTIDVYWNYLEKMDVEIF